MSVASARLRARARGLLPRVRLRPFGTADLYRISIEAGLKSLGRVPWRKAAARFVNPISYTRALEYELVLDGLGALDGKRVLDIGSPKLLAFAIGRHCEVDLVSTDIDGRAIESWEHVWPQVASTDAASTVRFEQADARALPYPDASFDAVYALSVVEHIPDAGDSVALAEIARVLRPGGSAVLTVPFDPHEYSEEWLAGAVFEREAGDAAQFYQRRYDEEALNERLATPALALEHVDYFGEPHVSFEPTWNRIPMMWKLPALWAQPLLARLFLRRLGAEPRPGALGVALRYRENSEVGA